MRGEEEKEGRKEGREESKKGGGTRSEAGRLYRRHVYRPHGFRRIPPFSLLSPRRAESSVGDDPSAVGLLPKVFGFHLFVPLEKARFFGFGPNSVPNSSNFRFNSNSCRKSLFVYLTWHFYLDREENGFFDSSGLDRSLRIRFGLDAAKPASFSVLLCASVPLLSPP
ncbi:hypothetical protein NL676_022955 [Syzygium grande]|nr:hypothetical protein NL676_022955 [Syzygium grande]